MSRFYLFLYGKLISPYGVICEFLGLIATGGWFYFAFVHKAFFSRFMQGTLTFTDLLIGLPLVIALGIVVYAIVIWSIKWLFLIFAPALVIPPDEDDDFSA